MTMTDDDFLTRTRRSYDAVASAYAEQFRDELAGKPMERAVLSYFAALVPRGKVLDVGSGPGRVTAHLAALGLDISGVDLSPSMVALAREDHPELRFEVGSMTRLPAPARSLAGVVAFYSTIHVPDHELPSVLAAFHQALVPGGVALLAFQVGDEPLVKSQAYGHDISLDFHRRRPEQMAELLSAAGLQVSACMVRDAEGPERTPHAFLVARKTGQ